MSKRNGHKRAATIHAGKLHNSHPNTTHACLGGNCPHPLCAVRAAIEVDFRVRAVLMLYGRTTGMEFEPDADLRGDMLKWRAMLMRHANNDYRHTDDEMKAMTAVAQWSLALNAKLRNQAPPKVELDPKL